MNKIKNLWGLSPRGVVLGVLGAVTLGVALLSVAVSYDILQPVFGAWAVPTVGALDALWVVFQATEILAGNNLTRAERVRYAGLALTVVNAAIPTVHLILAGAGGFDLAVVLAPVAIVATKLAWWVALPSLGRKTSAHTRQAIAGKRQEVDDQLETMEAEAAHRMELLKLATTLETSLAGAETDYRVSVLKAQQDMTARLHAQAVATAKTVADMGLPASVAAIVLPELGQWTPTAPALAVTAGRDASGTQLPALPGGRDASGTPSGTVHGARDASGTPVTGAVTQVSAGTGASASRPGTEAVTPAVLAVTPSGTETVTAPVTDGEASHTQGFAVTLAELAAVAGVPTPEPDEYLTDGQLDVVLRYLRHDTYPPQSYRQAVDLFRDAGYTGGEERVRKAWRALEAREKAAAPADADQPESSDEDQDEDEDAQGADSRS